MVVCAAAILARHFAGPGSLARSVCEIPGLSQTPMEGSHAA
jgi:hypothetical protein